MKPAVLDASALLALLNGEPGEDVVRQALPGALVLAVNLSEVIGVLHRAGMPPVEARATLRLLPIEVVPFDENLAYAAAALLACTRQTGLSLGDRACLALALREESGVLTGDRQWAALELPLDIRLIR